MRTPEAISNPGEGGARQHLQRTDAERAVGVALCPQHRRHSPRAEERPGGERLVDPPYQRESVVIGRRG